MCKHNICGNFISGNVNRSVEIVILNNYRFKGSNNVVRAFVLGSAVNSNNYNLCSGSLDARDNNCWIACVIRLMKEKFNIDLSAGGHYTFNQFNVNANGQNRTNYKVVNNTPWFFGEFPGFSCKIKNKDSNRKYNLEWFTIPNKSNVVTHIEFNNNCKVSHFADTNLVALRKHLGL